MTSVLFSFPVFRDTTFHVPCEELFLLILSGPSGVPLNYQRNDLQNLVPDSGWTSSCDPVGLPGGTPTSNTIMLTGVYSKPPIIFTTLRPNTIISMLRFLAWGFSNLTLFFLSLLRLLDPQKVDPTLLPNQDI